jgi:hypothetical protein
MLLSLAALLEHSTLYPLLLNPFFNSVAWNHDLFARQTLPFNFEKSISPFITPVRLSNGDGARNVSGYRLLLSADLSVLASPDPLGFGI